MVMRWKILELAERSETLEELLEHVKACDELGVDEEGAVALLRQYAEILPQGFAEKLAGDNGETFDQEP